MLLNGQVEYNEVQFYFLLFLANSPNKSPIAYMFILVYFYPIQELLNESPDTLWACHYINDRDLHVVKLFRIMTYVSMQPLPLLLNDPSEL